MREQWEHGTQTQRGKIECDAVGESKQRERLEHKSKATHQRGPEQVGATAAI